MRISNRSKIAIYNFINMMLLLILVGGIIAFFLEDRLNILGDLSYLFIVIPAAMLCTFYVIGRQIFEYDSDGEALNFRNRNIVPFINKPLSDEFPKYKLISYEIVDMFLIKRLYVKVSSKNMGSTMLKYEISYLSKKEIKDLKFSLNKVVKTNNEKKELIK